MDKTEFTESEHRRICHNMYMIRLRHYWGVKYINECNGVPHRMSYRKYKGDFYKDGDLELWYNKYKEAFLELNNEEF